MATKLKILEIFLDCKRNRSQNNSKHKRSF